MRIEQSTIALVPRTAAGCLDLALMFFGQHLRPILALWLLVALPSCILVYAVAQTWEVGLWFPMLVIFFASSPLGVALTVQAANTAFGDPFTFRAAVGRTLRQYPGALIIGFMSRISIAAGLALCLVPGVWLAIHLGFAVERRVLARLSGQQNNNKADDIVKSEFTDLLLRAGGIFGCCLAIGAVVFVSLDWGIWLLFGYKIYLGRVLEGLSLYTAEGVFEYQASLWTDPVVQSLLCATALLVYPIGRLAWLFCYVDVQVRRDCWDIQLQFLQKVEEWRERAAGDSHAGATRAGSTALPGTKARAFAGLVLAAAAFTFTNTASAQAPEWQDADDVRRSADEILSSSEFRHLKRLRDQLREAGFEGIGSGGDESGGGKGGKAKSGGKSTGDKSSRTPSDSKRKSSSENETDTTKNDSASRFTSPAFEAIGSAVGAAFHAIAWIVLAVVCGLIIYLIAQAVMNFERGPRALEGFAPTGLGGEDEPQTAPGDQPADVYLANARELAAAGRFREAVAQLMLGAMSHIERAGLIRFRRGLTYRDYLRAVAARPATQAGLRSMVRVYEPIGFGRRDATRAHFDSTLAGYESGFHGKDAALEI